MAAAHCATATATATAAATTISFHFPPPRNRFAIVCAIPTRFPPKPTKRKNYLRPKILKTLTKPYPIPHELTPANPLIPIESPIEQQLDFRIDEFATLEVKDSDRIEIQPLPEFCSDQLGGREVEGLNPIGLQQDFVADEEVKESDPIERQSPEFRYASSIEGQPGFPYDQFSVEGMREYNEDDQFAGEEYDVDDRIEQLPELDADRFAGEEIAVSEEREFSQSQEMRSSPELVKPIAGNPFSGFSMIEIGLTFIAAGVIDIVLSIWMSKKFKSIKKDQSPGIVDGNNKPNSKILLKENNDGNNKPNSEILLKENNDGKNTLNWRIVLKAIGNSIAFKNKGVVVNESEMDKKIEMDKKMEMDKKIAEIQGLAREVREKDKLEKEGNGVEENDDDDDDPILRRSKRSSKKQLSSPEGLAADKASKTLMSKKNRRVTSLGIDAEDTKPKGVNGSRDHGVPVTKTNGNLQNGRVGGNDIDVPRADLLNTFSRMSLEKLTGMELPAKDTGRIHGSTTKFVKERAPKKRRVTRPEQLNQSRADVSRSSSMSLEEDKGTKLPAEESTQTKGSRKKPVKKRRRSKPRETVSEQSTGIMQEKPPNLETQIYQNFVEAKRHDMLEPLFKKHDDLNGNGSLKVKEVGTGKANNGLNGHKSYTKTDFWWLSLPKVFAIVLRNGRGSEGLYILRSTSQDRGDTAYRVAFEDHADATNFCHILESYFGEFIGFSAAEITSIPTKELEKAVKSKTVELLVVKKGQIELHVGQSLTDVEEALRSLVCQS